MKESKELGGKVVDVWVRAGCTGLQRSARAAPLLLPARHLSPPAHLAEDPRQEAALGDAAPPALRLEAKLALQQGASQEGRSGGCL